MGASGGERTMLCSIFLPLSGSHLFFSDVGVFYILLVTPVHEPQHIWRKRPILAAIFTWNRRAQPYSRIWRHTHCSAIRIDTLRTVASARVVHKDQCAACIPCLCILPLQCHSRMTRPSRLAFFGANSPYPAKNARPAQWSLTGGGTQKPFLAMWTHIGF